MIPRSLLVALALIVVPTLPAQTKSPTAAPPKAEEPPLEKLSPKKGLFGQPAHDMAFSHDGKYAAYLHRPYKERKHGSDLWMLDVATGKTTRITSRDKM